MRIPVKFKMHGDHVLFASEGINLIIEPVKTPCSRPHAILISAEP
jgi:virulence-associated protein VagC